MKSIKKFATILLALAILLTGMPVGAASSPTKTNLEGKTFKISRTYNGKNQSVTSVVFNGKTLKVNTDFKITDNKSLKEPGTYKLNIKGIGKYTGTATVTVTISKPATETKPVVQPTVQPVAQPSTPKVAANDFNNQKFRITKTNNKKYRKIKKIRFNGKILKINKDFKVIKVRKMKNAGVYRYIIKGIGKYKGNGILTFKIKKRRNRIHTAFNEKRVSRKSLKKAGKYKKINPKIRAKTKCTYEVFGTSCSKKYARKHIKVSKRGTIRVKRSTKKGRYYIRITAKGTKNYKRNVKTICIRVK